MKTLLITLEFPPIVGGVANYLADICQQQNAEDLVVLTGQTLGSESFDNQQQYKIYCKPLLSKIIWPHWLLLLWRTWRIVKKEKIEVIWVGQVLPVGTVALILNKLLKIPFRVYTYGMDVTFAQKTARKRKLLKRILLAAEEIITISNFTKNKIIDLGIGEDKIKFIYPQAKITPQNYPVSQQNIQEFKNKFNLSGKKVILTVGRLTPRKGQDMVIKAMPQILQQVPQVVYLIVGVGKDKKRLQELINELNLNQQVILADKLIDHELAIAYQVCDLFVMVPREITGDFEGYGIVYKEAQSFNKPVIGSLSGGVSEAIGDNGVLVKQGDLGEIEMAVVKILGIRN